MGQIHFLLVYYRVSQRVLKLFIFLLFLLLDVLTGFGESVKGVSKRWLGKSELDLVREIRVRFG